MAVDAATFLTYSAIGNREDLSDVIYNIDPTETPFISGIDKIKASATFHEWQTQALDAVNSTNSVLEGDDAATDTLVPTVRLGNYHQISDKVARVSGTQMAVEHAGRDNELDYQVGLKGKELKRDMETIALRNQGRNAGAAGTPRATAAVLSYIYSNSDKGTNGSDPTTAGAGVSTRADGSVRAFTEVLLKSVLQKIWTNGGTPDMIMCGGFNKQQFSTFTGRSTPMEEAKSKKIVATVDVYEGDFGIQKVVANRFMRSRDVLILDMSMWAMATLPGRNMLSQAISKTGDSERRQILSEWTIEARNQQSGGIVADVTSA